MEERLSLSAHDIPATKTNVAPCDMGETHSLQIFKIEITSNVYYQRCLSNNDLLTVRLCHEINVRYKCLPGSTTNGDTVNDGRKAR